MYFIRVEIYEEKRKYPIVTHLFLGETVIEAKGYYNAHLKYDTFLAHCIINGQFGQVTCKTKVTEGWTTHGSNPRID